MRSLSLALVFLVGHCATLALGALVACNATHECPEELPCCSQYGTCGTGSYCLGGCDPRRSFNLSACMPQPRMDSFSDDMTDLNNFIEYTEYLGNASEYDWQYTGYLGTHDNALLLQMPNQSAGTVVSSTKYFWYGKVGATIKTSHGTGVVTAFISFSDVQDEIDYEFVGYNLTAPQTNFYALGILNYTNSVNASSTDTYENWHYYEFDWLEDRVEWLIDGKVVRTLNKDDTWNETTSRYDYPQTPARVQFSLWPAGSDLNGIGTIAWAGGAIDWDGQDIKDYGYYYAYVKNVTVDVYDLPSFLNEDNSTDLHAFLYNDTRGWESNVYLTDDKTWLGSSDATGLDPQNDEEPMDESSSSLGSSSKSSGSSGSDSTHTSTGKTSGTKTATQQSSSTTEGSGGFVQNNGASSSTAGSGVAMNTFTIESFIAGLLTVFGSLVAF